MVIKLYYFKPSPPSRSVQMTLKALNVEYEIIETSTFKLQQKSEEYMQINPRAKIPAITDGDLTMAESTAIQAYLCNKYEKKDQKQLLYPTDPVQRAKVDQMLCMAEVVDKAVRTYLLPKFVNFTDDSGRAALEEALQLLEKFLTKSSYLAGEHLTIADLAVYTWTTFPNVLPGGFDYSKYTGLSRWIKSIQSLPYYDECNKGTAEMIQTNLAARAQTKPALEFYNNFESPFSRAVHMTLEGLGLQYEFKEVDFENSQQKSAEYKKINPKGEVPAIRVGDFCLAESRAIAVYLCNEFAPNSSLYPKDAKQRAKVDQLLCKSMGVWRAVNDWVVSFMYEGGKPPVGESAAFEEVISDLESCVEGSFLTGDQVTLADFFLYVYADFANYVNYDWTKYPKLKAVFENVKSLPYHDEVNKKCLNKYAQIAQDKLAVKF